MNNTVLCHSCSIVLHKMHDAAANEAQYENIGAAVSEHAKRCMSSIQKVDSLWACHCDLHAQDTACGCGS